MQKLSFSTKYCKIFTIKFQIGAQNFCHYTFALTIPAVLGIFIYYMDVLTFEFSETPHNRSISINKIKEKHEWVDTQVGRGTLSREQSSTNIKKYFQLLSDIVFVLFALFNCAWSTVYLESWKRKQAELAYSWGYDTEENENTEKYLQEPRPGFKVVKKSIIDNFYNKNVYLL